MEKEQFNLQLKKHIIQYLNLLEMKPEDIADDMPFFGEGLALESIDALELAVLLEREYGIKITDPKEGRKIFVDVNTMANYILERSDKALS